MKIRSRINMFLQVVASVAIVVMTVHIVASVITRKIVGKEITGTIEHVQYIYMVYVTFLPLAYAQSLRQIVNVDAFMSWFGRQSPRAGLIVDATVLAAASGISLVLGWYGGVSFLSSITFGESLPNLLVPLWASWVVVPIGFFVLGAQFLTEAIERVKSGRP